MVERRRITTLKPRLQALDTRRVRPMVTADNRMTGSGLQRRRLSVWSRDPYCAGCRKLTAFPEGFALDHIVALVNGGEDTEANCQVLCHACHDSKTRDDLKGGR